MHKATIAPLCLAFLSGGAAGASGWELARGDDQGIFFASAEIPGVIGFRCGGQHASRSGPFPMMYQDSITDPGMVQMSLFQDAFAQLHDEVGHPDARLAVDGIGHSLRDIQYTDYHGGYWQQFATTDPLMAALRIGQEVTLWEHGTLRGAVPTRGMNAAIGGMIDYCAAGWAGQPLPGQAGSVPRFSLNPAPAAPAAAPAPTSAVDRLTAWMDRICPQGMRRATGALYYDHDLDGDGLEDAVLDPRGMTCNGQYTLCGQVHCETPVFLSSVPGADPSDVIFGHGPMINFRPDGLPVLEVTERCANGSFDCPPNAIRWQNGRAVRLP